MFNVLAAATMPTFPKVDLTEGVNWFRDGAVAIVTDNAMVVIGASIVIAGIVAAISFAKRFAKRNIKG